MAAERNDFIRDIIDEDLRTGRHTRVATRFPPEPNGYLHIGHAKAICVDFGIARDYQGTCNLRYDDTNPAKEDVEYVDAIEQDVRWLGFAPTAVLFSADYFPRMYELAERLVREGLAYVDDLDDEQIREYRGSLSEPGKPSPWRDRSVDENLDLLRRMRAGEFPDGARVLRAKIDLASANMKMRDPLLYRIRHAHHHRSGDAWVIYPMYDWAHPLEDAIEGITHSICTLEFENNRELYDWVLDHTGPWAPRPHQYEMARLQLDYTVMSKRKLLTLVQGKHVSGWDDPRMPTLVGLRRRGFAPEAIRAFIDMVGVAKANSWVDIGKLEYCVRDELNRNAPRAMGVLRPIEVEVAGGARIYIERDDWRDEASDDYHRLAPGRTVRLRHAQWITADAVVARDASGAVTKLRATAHAELPGDRKVWGIIHWVDAATAVTAEVRLYDRLFKVARPEDGAGDFLQNLDSASLEILHGARLEASFAGAPVGSRWQLERVGYFIVDEDSKPGAIVLNRTITLRDSYAQKTEAAAPEGEKKENTKAKTRPKSKSPREYRDEARVRDPKLGAAFATFREELGDEAADLVTGDFETLHLFDSVRGDIDMKLVAKWIINDLQRALGDRPITDVNADNFRALLKQVHAGALAHAQAKALLPDVIFTDAPYRAAVHGAAQPAAAADLGPAIDAVIAAHAGKVAEYKAGKTGLLGFFVGQVMKAAPGADAAAVNRAVRERLA